MMRSVHHKGGKITPLAGGIQDSFQQPEEGRHYTGCDSCDISVLALSAKPLAVFRLSRECLRGVFTLREKLSVSEEL